MTTISAEIEVAARLWGGIDIHHAEKVSLHRPCSVRAPFSINQVVVAMWAPEETPPTELKAQISTISNQSEISKYPRSLRSKNVLLWQGLLRMHLWHSSWTPDRQSHCCHEVTKTWRSQYIVPQSRHKCLFCLSNLRLPISPHLWNTKIKAGVGLFRPGVLPKSPPWSGPDHGYVTAH